MPPQCIQLPKVLSKNSLKTLWACFEDRAPLIQAAWDRSQMILANLSAKVKIVSKEIRPIFATYFC